MRRISESQLLLPALYLMAQSENGSITTGNLINGLWEVFQPSGIDAEILDGRNDTYFSQKVRNLKSHNTFERKKYAINIPGGFQITPEGRTFINDHMDALSYLFNEDFNYEDVKDAIEEISSDKKGKVIPIEETVSEGRKVTKNVQTRERSSKLRSRAVKHFTVDNKIWCHCCGFSFPEFYGAKYGKDCIEIHHKRPIFEYEGDSFEQLAERALKNLLPVCPNCHRLIHKNHIGSKEIDAFISEVKQRLSN